MSAKSIIIEQTQEAARVARQLSFALLFDDVVGAAQHLIAAQYELDCAAETLDASSEPSVVDDVLTRVRTLKLRCERYIPYLNRRESRTCEDFDRSRAALKTASDGFAGVDEAIGNVLAAALEPLRKGETTPVGAF